jgi:hypothetical protein
MADKTKRATVPDGTRVRALREGFYGGCRIRAGSTFTVVHADEFSDRWMRPVDPATPDDLAGKRAQHDKTPTRRNPEAGQVVGRGPAPQGQAGDGSKPKPTGAQNVLE